MFSARKIKIWIAIIVVFIGFLYAIVPMVRGPYDLQDVKVDQLRKVDEYKSEVNDYSIKIFYQDGPIFYYEYSYVGSLFKGDKFIRNIFWVGPSGNDFRVEWEGENIIKIHNLTESIPTLTLDILTDTYDFR